MCSVRLTWMIYDFLLKTFSPFAHKSRTLILNLYGDEGSIVDEQCCLNSCLS